MRIERFVAFSDIHRAALWTRGSSDFEDPYKKTVFAVDFSDETVFRTEPEFLHPSAGVISGRIKVVGEHLPLRGAVLSNGVAVVAMGGMIEAWTLGATEPKWTYTSDDGYISAIDLAGNTLFYAASGKVTQLDGDTGRVLGESINVGGCIYHLAVSPCRQYMAIVKDSATTLIGQAGSHVACPAGNEGSAPLSANVSSPQSGIRDQLLVIRLSDQKQCFSRPYASKIFKPVFSPDGCRLVVADHDRGAPVCIVNVRYASAETVVGEHSGVTGGYWSPNRNCLYSWGHDGVVRAWNLDTGELKWTFQMQSGHQTPLKIALAAALGVFKS